LNTTPELKVSLESNDYYLIVVFSSIFVKISQSQTNVKFCHVCLQKESTKDLYAIISWTDAVRARSCEWMWPRKRKWQRLVGTCSEFG